MAFRRAVLIAGALAALCARPALAAGRASAPECASCHAGHHYARFGTCTGCHRGSATAHRKNLAHERLLRGDAAAWGIPGAPAVRDGQRLRDQLACRRCHVTGGTGNAYAISLDAVAWRRDQDDLRNSILHPATFMPDFGLSSAQADRLIAALLRDGNRAGREERYLVHFRAGAATPNAFATKCGPCHRALTTHGPMGAGRAGPNLTGLLTPYYPRTDGRAWDRARLERWVANPRAERPGTTMHPVTVDSLDLQQIAQLLGAAPSPLPGRTRAQAERPATAPARSR